ncbi:anti-sigma factor [Nocardioides sp.]|uniref:anti-sigma factor n=1 Tax=Nocardioides sp. TaxID=35761 RepID=UPI002717B4B6|nr:anti-sigma factor [Nocardioides sp.]MDO9457154.1 anti-sigma factor [Nocardioides sp.]
MSVDIHALSGAYAVDAVDEFERAQFERHLADCPTCQAEVDSLREAGSLIGETSALTPPDSLRESVLAGIQSVRPLPPVMVAAAERGRATRRRFPALVAAAAALIAIGGIGATAMDLAGDDDKKPGVELADSPTDQVLNASDAQRVVRNLPDGGTATVVRSVKLKQAVIVTEDLPDAPTLHTYELWLQRGSDMIPAGQIGGGSSTVLLKGDAAMADGVGITVELAGEQPTEPSDKIVDVIGFEQA